MPLTQFVRPVRPSDAGDCIEWAKTQPEWDAFIAAHPGTFVLASYDKQKVVAYLPVQQPYVIETLSPNPDATDLEVAVALKEFIQFLVTQAHIKNVAEIYFLSSNKNTDIFASNHIFEKLEYDIYRARISDLEPVKKEV